MNVAMVTICDALGVYSAQRMQQLWPNVKIIRPSRVPAVTPSLPNLTSVVSPTRANPLYVATRDGYAQARQSLQERHLARALFGRSEPPEPPPHIEVPRSELRSHGGPLRDLAPDVLVLNGAPLLKPEVLRIPAVTTINMHFGISPAYRGSHTVFQAMARSDWDHVGLTLHQVDAGVDTGDLLAHVFPPLVPTDTEATILAKCVQLGTEALIEVLTSGAVTSGTPQAERGRLYRARDRHPMAEVRQVARRLLGERPPRRPGRVERYDRTSLSGTSPHDTRLTSGASVTVAGDGVSCRSMRPDRQVATLSDPAMLACFRDDWERLRTDLPGPTTQLDWVVAHALELPDEDRLCAVATFESGRLTAIAPLILSGSSPRRLRWLGIEDVSGALYRDERALRRLVDAIYQLRRPVAIGALLPGFPTETALQERRRRSWVMLQRSWHAGPSLPLDGSWVDPITMLSPKRRSEMQRVSRKARSLGDVSFEVIAPGDEVVEHFEEFLRVEARGWKGRAGTALIHDRAQREALRRYLTATARQGSVRISRMRIDDTTVASHLNVVVAGRLWGLKGGVDEAFRAVAPGLQLFAFTIGAAAGEDLEAYEFMGRTAPFKEMWGAEAAELQRRRLYPPNPRGATALAFDLARQGAAQARRFAGPPPRTGTGDETGRAAR